MSGHIVNFDQSEHQPAQELLPWYAMDKLSSDEQALVRDHLQTCAQCRADLEWERKLLAAEPESAHSFDMEGALARLMPSLEARRGPTAQGRLAGLLRNLRQGNAAWMRWALAAQSVAILMLALPMLKPADTAPYRVLGAQQNAAGNAVVVFAPETTEQDMRQILQASGARILDGPTVTDAYLLNIPAGRLDSSIRMLRAEKGVKLAEALVSGGKP